MSLWVVGANPLQGGAQGLGATTFLVVQDLFMTETAQQADIVLPAASAYEKNGTVTNVCGEVQKLKAAIKVMGTKTDLEIFGLIAKEMGLAVLGIWLPDKVFEEIRETVHGYDVPLPVVATGGAGRDHALERPRGGSAGRDCIRRRHAVHFRHARAVFESAELRDGSPGALIPRPGTVTPDT